MDEKDGKDLSSRDFVKRARGRREFPLGRRVGRNNGVFTRRQFLVQSSVVSAAFASATGSDLHPGDKAQALFSEQVSASNQLSALKNSFLKPAFDTRPMTRWWWFGGAVTAAEITRELTLMRDAGLRGVELQPVYPLVTDDPQLGIRNTRYFSPEWFDLLRHTVEEARRLGLQLDLTLGSGWPYGGPFIPVELAARKLQVVMRDVMGPSDFVWDLGTEFPEDARFLATLALPILPSEIADIANTRVIGQNQTARWRVPPGPWRIMIFVDCPTLMQVKRPTLGMEGYVLDHFRREALDLFLDAVGNRTLDELRALGQPPFHSVFCDSLEVEAADWTGDFLKEFRERRGYDLTPYLPALWQDAGPLTPHIRYDYHRTLSELTLNNFFRPLAEWSQQHGMTARVQAHGAMGDVMQGYGLAHIPEGEHFGSGDEYRVDIAHRRLASSAGHIYQKPVISAETYTWLHAPLFTVPLEMMKAATDAQFLDGMNQIVNHGYPYSPPQAGQPGWTFYASTVINHNNLWWRHYPQLARYIQRCAGMLLEGVSINPVAVYLPLADVYAKFGAGGLHIDEVMELHLGTELVLGLRRAGYDFDFINDDALQSIAKVKDGRLMAGTGVYSAVIVPEGQYIPLDSFYRLAEFVQAGGWLFFVKHVPSVTPGLVDQESQTRRLGAALNNLWGGTVHREGEFVPSGKGKVYKASGIPDVIRKLREGINVEFAIVRAGDNSDAARKLAVENVGFVHRRLGTLDLYFVSNVSRHGQDLRVQFAVGNKTPQRWNPETAAMQETLVYEYVEVPQTRESVTEVQFRLDPFESCFIVFTAPNNRPSVTRTNWPGPLKIEQDGGQIRVAGAVPSNGDYFLADADGKQHRFSVRDVPQSLEISGPWRLTFDDGATLTLPLLKAWTELPERRAYSGWVSYETDFKMKDLGNDIEWVVDLGAVHETAEVSLNGIRLGIAWKGLRRVYCRDALKPGLNHLKVEVANLWINRVESLPTRNLKPVAETYGIRWGLDEKNLRPPILPSGLVGPVVCVPLKRWTEQLQRNA
jgi:glycosyl hydrolase family 106( putative alpha-L-rhamnosidase)